MRAVPKVMLPILLHWSMTSEVDVGGMAVEVEQSYLYSITFCYCVIDMCGHREAGMVHATVTTAETHHPSPQYTRI